MKVYVENVGRVAKADVNLAGITLVAGNNSSGKSTISKSLYTGLSVSYKVQEKVQSQKRRSINKAVQNWSFGNSWFRRIPMYQRREVRRSIQVLFQKPLVEKEIFTQLLLKFLAGYEVNDVPDESIDSLYHEYLDIQTKGDEYYRNYFAQLTLNSVFYEQINTENRIEDAQISIDFGEESILLRVSNNKLNMFKIDMDHEYMVKPIYVTTSNLMDSLNQFSQGRENEYSSANAELAGLMMQEFNASEKTAEEYYAVEEQKNILAALLNQVIDGELKKTSTRLVFHENWCNADIELPNIASGMKLFVMLKRLVSNGSLLGKNMLIIDEPETNLHPEWQLKLAELLVLIYKNLGICIYLNSHSPYFVRAVEYFAHLHGVLDATNFYMMEPDGVKGMYQCIDVTQNLGVIYDKLAEPFNQIM